MGTVYRADQTAPVKRQVALKLIKIGMDSRAVLARFDAERQALALMDHANIARVYDGGTTAAGQPFFVMELVTGMPITEYCDRHRFPVRARLELFASVCQAVQHAHQKGIIHRDLNPRNVLVTELDGRPAAKVIDFGVAKATEFKLTDQTLADTGAIVGTPAYMSPEQADPSTVDIDTRTDIYALGVILYELLAGSPPLDAKKFKRGAVLEMLRMVREVDPLKPSAKASTSEALPSIAASRGIEPAQLKRAIEGDLDWIVMMALEKDRSRRYETANGFAADVLRHLAHEPVAAAPPSRAYRLRKFVRKNRGAMIAASLVVLALLAGIAGTSWGLFRAARALTAEGKRVTERDEALKKGAERAKERDVANNELKHRLGISNFNLARSAYDNRDVILAAERLDDVPPQQRGWEWHYLKQQARGGVFTLYGHTGHVSSVSFSPDGTRIVTGSGDNTAKVWDAHTGTTLQDLKGHMSSVTSVSFSPDSTRIVTGSGDRTAKVWDARSGALLLELNGHSSWVLSVSFSPDGTRIVTASRDNTTKVWDARTGTALLELKGHTNPVRSVSFSPDGTRIITSGGERDKPGEATVWDARTGAILLELEGHRDRVWSVAFNPDGTRIVTGSNDQTAKVWDARTGTALLELRGHTGGLSAVSFSPDGTRIVTGSWDNTAKVWDARTGKALLELKGHTGEVTSVAFSPDGTGIITGSYDQTAKIWDARTGTAQLELHGHTSYVRSVSFSPDDTRIVTGSWDNTARVWDVRSGTTVLELKGHAEGLRSASFSPDGTRIVTGSNDQTAMVWDARTGTPLLGLKGHTGGVTSVSFSPDGARIVTGSEDKTATVWDARTGTGLLELKGHAGGVTSVSFSPDGTRIVTGSGDSTAKVWDARTGRATLDLKGHASAVTSVSFSSDGTRIVTGSADSTAKVWDARTGRATLVFNGHASALTSGWFSSDGTRIVTGSPDNTAKVWDVRTGTALLELKGHTNSVTSVAFSSDGTRIVTGSGDNTVKVWDARTGAPRPDLKGHTSSVFSVSFSPDGTRIVTGSGDNTAKVWDARTGTALLELRGHVVAVCSVSFSPDGTRIVTGSEDRTARVWDARAGTALLDLKGHTGLVWSVSFSPDGTSIVTGSGERTAKVWDARTGTALLAVIGHTGDVRRVWFSPDGSRIVTSSGDITAMVWDARTGQEMKGEPIPPALWPHSISPDGRLIAHAVGNRVDLIPMQPDAEELEFRRVHTQPTSWRYREGYDAARKAEDQFAARFYLDLLPPTDRMRCRAEAIVAPLFAHLLLRDDVLAALQAHPAADPEVQAGCLDLAGAWTEPVAECNDVGWSLVRKPGQQGAFYERGLHLAQAACRLRPDNGSYLNTLGVAQYRCGLIAEAIATLSRSDDLNKGNVPADLAFLALAQSRLGHSGMAHSTLARLRELMKDPERPEDQDAQAFLREAETIELDQAFPANPFAS